MDSSFEHEPASKPKDIGIARAAPSPSSSASVPKEASFAAKALENNIPNPMADYSMHHSSKLALCFKEGASSLEYFGTTKHHPVAAE